MNTSQPTYSPRAAEIERNWRVIDAANRPLGRVASEAAHILRGKDKPSFTPHMDVGDFVVIVNAAKIRVSGAKHTDKTYYSHSGYPGGLKSLSFDSMMEKSPRRVMEYAVWGMLPKGPLGRRLLGKLKVYAEDSHPHGAQIKDLSRPDRAGKPKKKPKPPKAARAALVDDQAEPIPAEVDEAEAALAEDEAATEAAVESGETQEAPEADAEPEAEEAASGEQAGEAAEAQEAPSKPARKRQPAKRANEAGDAGESE